MATKVDIVFSTPHTMSLEAQSVLSRQADEFSVLDGSIYRFIKTFNSTKPAAEILENAKFSVRAVVELAGRQDGEAVKIISGLAQSVTV